MKKQICVILAFILALAFAGCSNTAATTTTTAAETTAAAQEEAQETFYYGELAYGGRDAAEMNAYYAEKYASKSWNDGTVSEQWDSVLYDDLTSALLGLERHDIFTLDLLEPVAKYVAAHNEQTMEARDYDSSANVALAMAVKSENTELLEKLNGAIETLKKDGTLEKLEKEYTADPTALPESAELPKIDGGETIRVVVTGDMPPYDYVATDGKAAGYNIALLSAISEKAGLNVELVYSNAASRFLQLTSDKADAIFWARGNYYSESAEFDFSSDVPEGMAVTTPYTTQRLWGVYLRN